MYSISWKIFVRKNIHLITAFSYLYSSLSSCFANEVYVELRDHHPIPYLHKSVVRHEKVAQLRDVSDVLNLQPFEDEGPVVKQIQLSDILKMNLMRMTQDPIEPTVQENPQLQLVPLDKTADLPFL